MTTIYLEEDIEFFEGKKLFAYKDIKGNVTWGIGHMDNKVKVGTKFTPAQIDVQFKMDCSVAKTGLDHHMIWWRQLSDVRQDVMVNMAFNLGVEKLCEFHSFLADAREDQFVSAGHAMLSSAWAKEVKSRAQILSKQFSTGVRVDPRKAEA